MRYVEFNKLDWLKSLDILSDDFVSENPKNTNVLCFRARPFTLALNLREFYVLCANLKLTDENVEKYRDRLVLISITRSKREHYFHKNHKNVLNLEFDDVLESNDKYYRMDDKQAIKAVKFIKSNQEDNVNKLFITHCHAGISRSGAFAKTMAEYFGYDIPFFFSKNCQVCPNHHVVSLLKEYGLSTVSS